MSVEETLTRWSENGQTLSRLPLFNHHNQLHLWDSTSHCELVPFPLLAIRSDYYYLFVHAGDGSLWRLHNHEASRIETLIPVSDFTVITVDCRITVFFLTSDGVLYIRLSADLSRRIAQDVISLPRGQNGSSYLLANTEQGLAVFYQSTNPVYEPVCFLPLFRVETCVRGDKSFILRVGREVYLYSPTRTTDREFWYSQLEAPPNEPFLFHLPFFQDFKAIQCCRWNKLIFGYILPDGGLGFSYRKNCETVRNVYPLSFFQYELVEVLCYSPLHPEPFVEMVSWCNSLYTGNEKGEVYRVDVRQTIRDNLVFSLTKLELPIPLFLSPQTGRRTKSARS